MKRKRNLLVVGVIVGVCLAAARLAGRSFDTERKEKTYEVEAIVTTPEYRTDAARAIDAYERLIERYIGLVEGHLLQVVADCRKTAQKLDLLDAKLDNLSARLARIEKAMKIAEPNVNLTTIAKPIETKEAGRITVDKENQP